MPTNIFSYILLKWKTDHLRTQLPISSPPLEKKKVLFLVNVWDSLGPVPRGWDRSPRGWGRSQRIFFSRPGPEKRGKKYLCFFGHFRIFGECLGPYSIFRERGYLEKCIWHHSISVLGKVQKHPEGEYLKFYF